MSVAACALVALLYNIFNSELLLTFARREGAVTLDIAILPGAYQTLMEAALDALPAESFGALIGRSGTGMGAWGIIEEVAPVALIPVQAGLAPDMQQWHALEERLGKGTGGENGRSILGWFYTDSAIGIFRPRTNVVQVADMLGANGALLLIVNPVARQGGFYVKMGDRFAPAGDFHEVLPEEGGTPIVPWTGEIQGVEEWLGDSYTTFAYSTGNIEDYEIPPNVPRRGSRFAVKTAQGPAATDSGAPNEEAKESAGATDGAAKADSEPESTMQRDSNEAGTPAADKRSGPITAPLPPLDRNEVVAGGEQVRERGSRGLLVAGVVIGIVLVVLVSIALIYGFGGSSDPTIAGIAGPAQTATARTVSLALSPTVGITAQPTQTTAVIVAATTTPPPTSTTARIDTPTATTTSVPTSTATTAPSATPSPAAITYVVQPGDTLTYIARIFGTTVDALMAENGLTSTEITVGQILKIP